MTDLEFKAKALAIKHHEGQFRKSNGQPYSEHLFEVVELLKAVAHVRDENLLAAAWLHDVLEDTDCLSTEILQCCGQPVLDLVIELSDDKSKSLSERRDNILSKLSGTTNQIRLIKLADIISNVKLLPAAWSREKSFEYLNWLDNVALACRCSSESLYQTYLSNRSQHH